MEELILFYVQKYPLLVSILAFLMGLRLVMKPLFTAIHAYVDNSESKKDDELLAKVEASKYYKSFLWVLDYLFSIKIKAEGSVALPAVPKVEEKK
jgi:hypothetical protein